MTFVALPSAADRYTAQVDAVLEQRTRLRGPRPPGDLFDALPANHFLLESQPHQPLSPNDAVIAEYLRLESVVIDVGGGAGRTSLPLALRCARVINVEPSGAMAGAFLRNAAAAGIRNVETISSSWQAVDPRGVRLPWSTMLPI